MVYDVAIIGGGVIGSLIARELSKYHLNICIIEKESDNGVITTSANSGIIHAGYDANPNTLKAKMNVEGNSLIYDLCKDLHVPAFNTGAFVIAFDNEQEVLLEKLVNRAKINEVPSVEIVSKQFLLNKEPHVSSDIKVALYAKTGGIVSPYKLALNAAESAAQNGVDIFRETEVKSIDSNNELITLICEDQQITTRYLINSAGLNADEICSLVENPPVKINPVKGEYLLMDKKLKGYINAVIFQTPTKKGKGILVSQTVDGNIILGPTADKTDFKNDFETTISGLDSIRSQIHNIVPNLNLKDVITSFAGLRAKPDSGDFYIAPSKTLPNMINLIGIESPGLTSAPAIAVYTVNILKEQGLDLNENSSFYPKIERDKAFSEMSNKERAVYAKKSPAHSKIVCRCEKVTEAEIINAINRPAGARTIDGIKRRTRAGMGRCQGGFCIPGLIEILSRESGIPIENITKSGKGSNMLVGKKL